MSLWAKAFDASSDKYYYYNKETNATTWDQPAEYIEEDSQPGGGIQIT